MGVMSTSPVHAWQADPVIAAVRGELAKKGIRANQLPGLIGGSQAYWGRRMIADTEMSVSDLRSLARLLGVPVAKFFEEDETAPHAGREGRLAHSEGLEPPTCCFGVGCHECQGPDADVIEIFTRQGVLL